MVLVLENIQKHFGHTDVLKGVNTSLSTGKTALLGENGAGKTTLLRILATTLSPSDGSVSLDGINPLGRHSRTEYRRQLGYLPQVMGAYGGFSCYQFLEYCALLKGCAMADIPRLIERALTQVDLTDRRGARVRTLSGGMLRRLGIAQSIINQPAIVLLDEPTVGLDPRQRIEMRQLINAIGENAIVLVSTHLVEDVAATCDRVLVLHDGRFRFQGTVEELTMHDSAEVPGDSPLERAFNAVTIRGAAI